MSTQGVEVGNVKEEEKMWPADHWLRKLIRRAEDIRALASPELLQYHLDNGFDL